MKKRVMIAIMSILMAWPLLSQNLVTSLLNDIDKGSKQGITQVNISGRMLRMAMVNDPHASKEMKELFGSIDRISMVTGLSVSDKVDTKLNKLLAPYEELMSVTEDDQTIRMYTRETKKGIEEFVLCAGDIHTITMMSITGKIDLKQLSRLSESVRIEGMEHLHYINEKEEEQQ